MADRRFDHNLGMLSLPTIPDDVYIVGAGVVVSDDDGHYRTICVAGNELTTLPHEDVQEGVGGMLADAFMIANLEQVAS